MITAPSIFIFAASLATPVAADSCLDLLTANKLSGAALDAHVSKCTADDIGGQR